MQIPIPPLVPVEHLHLGSPARLTGRPHRLVQLPGVGNLASTRGSALAAVCGLCGRRSWKDKVIAALKAGIVRRQARHELHLGHGVRTGASARIDVNFTRVLIAVSISAASRARRVFQDTRSKPFLLFPLKPLGRAPVARAHPVPPFHMNECFYLSPDLYEGRTVFNVSVGQVRSAHFTHRDRSADVDCKRLAWKWIQRIIIRSLSLSR